MNNFKTFFVFSLIFIVFVYVINLPSIDKAVWFSNNTSNNKIYLSISIFLELKKMFSLSSNKI